jgi:hypothetical protein
MAVKLAFNTLTSGGIKMVRFAVIASFAVVFYVLTIRATFQVSHIFFTSMRLGQGSPGEIRTLVGGSKARYAWPLHHRACLRWAMLKF